MNLLTFDQHGFDAAIVLHGSADYPVMPFSQLTPHVIATDGACLSLNKFTDCVPTIITGDFDSISPEQAHLLYPSAQIIVDHNQENNDFEKSLLLCSELNALSILVVGFHGGLLEHTLNNWSVMMKYSKSFQLCIYDCKRYGLPFSESFSFSARFDEIVSIIPQPVLTASLSGFQWNLHSETLELGSREGARNRAVESLCSINVLSGSAMLFLDERLPFRPVFVSS